MPGGHRGYPSCMIKHAIRRPWSLEREVCCRAGVHALGVQVGEREDRAGQVIPRDLALVGAVVKPTGQLSVEQRDNELAEVTPRSAGPSDRRPQRWSRAPLPGAASVSYTHLRAHETGRNLVCRLLLEKKKKK